MKFNFSNISIFKKKKNLLVLGKKGLLTKNERLKVDDRKRIIFNTETKII